MTRQFEQYSAYTPMPTTTTVEMVTDNRTTEPINDRVNRLLHEAGADFTVRSLMRTGSMDPYDKFTVFDADKMPAAQIETSGHNDETVLLTLRCTPKQAIAATMGSGTLTAEQVMAIAGKHQPDYCSDTHVCFDWQAIADELNAELGSGTCHITASSTDGLCSDNPRQYFKLSCGHSFTLDGLGAPVACPVCGKAVER